MPTPASTALQTSAEPLDDLTLAKTACEGRSLLVDSRAIGQELLPGYSPGYVRALLRDDAAPNPVKMSGGSFFYIRLEVALYLLRRERVTAVHRRERTEAATRKRLRDYARPGGGRRLAKTRQAAAIPRKSAATAASTHQ